MQLERGVDKIRARLRLGNTISATALFAGVVGLATAALKVGLGVPIALGLIAVGITGLWVLRNRSIDVIVTAGAVSIERRFLGRVTRSSLLPLDAIGQVRTETNGGLVIRMIDGEETTVPIGSRQDLVVLKELIQARAAAVQPAAIADLQPPEALARLMQQDSALE